MSFVSVCHSFHRSLWYNIHFIKVTKDFKSINHLKTKKFTQSVIKNHIPRSLCFFNRKRKSNFRLVPTYIHCKTIVIHSVKVTIKDFKGSLMSLRNLYHVQNSLSLVTNLFYTSVFISLFAHSENSTCKFRCTSFFHNRM